MKEGLTPSKIDQFLTTIKPSPVVALVMENPAAADSLQRSLHDEGYQIYRTSRAEDLVARFSEIRPDVIVMAALLPGMNGLSALDELRPQTPEEIVPIVIISQRADTHAKLLAFRRGAFDYITEPFDAEEVAARVRTLVRTKILREMLQVSSVFDPLTSVYNRRFILVWLEREIERVKRYGLEFSCLLVDLDHFGEINEENGRNFGDHLLREFAALMTQHTRRSDIVGRIQNDEFLIFLPGTTKEQAMMAARRLRTLAAQQDFEWKGKKIKLTFCMGILGCHADEAPAAPVFLEKAQEALEKAKAVGAGETAVLGIH